MGGGPLALMASRRRPVFPAVGGGGDQRRSARLSRSWSSTCCAPSANLRASVRSLIPSAVATVCWSPCRWMPKRRGRDRAELAVGAGGSNHGG